MEQGLKLREQGKLDEALVEFQKGYGINPASTMATEEIERTKRMIEREKEKPAAERKPEEAALTPAEAERQKEQKKFEAMQPLPELKPLNPEPIYLKMNNQPPKVLFETVGKYAGINVLFDPDYTSGTPMKPQSIELNNSTLTEALDDLASDHEILLETPGRQHDFRHPGHPHHAAQFRRLCDQGVLSE